MGQPINFYSLPEQILQTAVLYLPMDTGFSDAGTGNHTVSNVGTVVDTLDYVVGGGSGSFDGTDYLQITYSSDLDIADTDMITIDFYFKLSNVSNTQYFYIHGNTATYNRLLYARSGSDSRFIFEVTSSAGHGDSISAFVPLLTADQWYRFRFVKQTDRTCLMYLNGSLIASSLLGAGDVNGTFWTVKVFDAYIGQSSAGSSFIAGHIDEFVFSRGVYLPGGTPVNFYSRGDSQPINFYSGA